jgi:hypothetical protein
MKASKFLKLKTRLAQASDVIVEAAKELSVVVEKAVKEVVEAEQAVEKVEIRLAERK